MSGLSDTPIEVKPGLLEFAVAFNDVMEAFKKPNDVYQKVLAEHTALKKTLAEQKDTLTKNEAIANEHRASRAEFDKQQKQAKIESDKKEADFKSREQEIMRQLNAISAREAAVQRREREVAANAAAVAKREDDAKARETDLIARETALAETKKKVAADQDAIREKQEKLRAVIG